MSRGCLRNRLASGAEQHLAKGRDPFWFARRVCSTPRTQALRRSDSRAPSDVPSVRAALSLPCCALRRRQRCLCARQALSPRAHFAFLALAVPVGWLSALDLRKRWGYVYPAQLRCAHAVLCRKDTLFVSTSCHALRFSVRVAATVGYTPREPRAPGQYSSGAARCGSAGRARQSSA